MANVPVQPFPDVEEMGSRGIIAIEKSPAYGTEYPSQCDKGLLNLKKALFSSVSHFLRIQIPTMQAPFRPKTSQKSRFSPFRIYSDKQIIPNIQNSSVKGPRDTGKQKRRYQSMRDSFNRKTGTGQLARASHLPDSGKEKIRRYPA